MTDKKPDNTSWESMAAANGVLAIMYATINKNKSAVIDAIPKIQMQAYEPASPVAPTYAAKKGA